MAARRLGEEAIIRALTGRFGKRPHAGLVKGIGDDAAVCRVPADKDLILTVDTLVEGVHFKLSYFPPRCLGRKAAAVSFSDVAAMGGRPLFMLVSLSMPSGAGKAFVDGLYDGLSEISNEYGVSIAGGNISASRGIVVTTVVFGEAKKGRAAYRSGARPGDDIYVTGTPGDSALGLLVLKKYGSAALKKKEYKNAVLRHLCPEPRVEAGRLLSGIVSSMIDVSDGLMLDLSRILSESGVGAEVGVELIPLSREFKGHTRSSPGDLRLALSGGEDYELLFTAPTLKARAVAAVSEKTGLKITRIGTVIRGKKARLLKAGSEVKLKSLGYEHFR